MRFSGRPDTQIDHDPNARHVVKTATEGPILGVEHHPMLDTTICTAVPQTVLKLNKCTPRPSIPDNVPEDAFND